ncbi:unnamed protein product, partial [Peniophora sp. CBMAI 1063]
MEILETLWSVLNLVTTSCRNMSRANREETINFNINDINLKKIRNLTPDMKAVESELLEREHEASEEQGLVKLVINRLQIQIEQLSWQAFDKNHKPLSESNQAKLSSARADLKSRIKKHNALARELFGPLPATADIPSGDPLFGAGVRLGTIPDEDPSDDRGGTWRQDRQIGTRQPEFYPVDLPSSRGGDL